MEKKILVKKYDRALKRINVVLLISFVVNVIILFCLTYFKTEYFRWMLSSYYPIHMIVFFDFMREMYGILSIIGTIIAFVILLSCIFITLQINKKYKKLLTSYIIEKDYVVVKNRRVMFFLIIALFYFIIILHIVPFFLVFLNHLF